MAGRDVTTHARMDCSGAEAGIEERNRDICEMKTVKLCTRNKLKTYNRGVFRRLQTLCICQSSEKFLCDKVILSVIPILLASLLFSGFSCPESEYVLRLCVQMASVDLPVRTLIPS